MLYIQVDPWAKYELNLKTPRIFASMAAKRTRAPSQVPDTSMAEKSTFTSRK